MQNWNRTLQTVIAIGSRAKVYIDGELAAVTHWSGWPDMLGETLVKFVTRWDDCQGHYDGSDMPLDREEALLGALVRHQIDTVGGPTEDFIDWEYDIRGDKVFAKKPEMDEWRELPESYRFGLYDIEKYVETGELKKSSDEDQSPGDSE